MRYNGVARRTGRVPGKAASYGDTRELGESLGSGVNISGETGRGVLSVKHLCSTLSFGLT